MHASPGFSPRSAEFANPRFARDDPSRRGVLPLAKSGTRPRRAPRPRLSRVTPVRRAISRSLARCTLQRSAAYSAAAPQLHRERPRKRTRNSRTVHATRDCLVPRAVTERSLCNCCVERTHVHRV